MRIPVLIAAAVAGPMSCSSTSPETELGAIDVAMPSRTTPPDTSRVTPTFSAQGGNVFVRLTAEPTSRALEVLGLAGMAPPATPSHPTAIVVFDNLHIATTWGRIQPGGVRRLALLRFVSLIEPSGGDTIGPASARP